MASIYVVISCSSISLLVMRSVSLTDRWLGLLTNVIAYDFIPALESTGASIPWGDEAEIFMIAILERKQIFFYYSRRGKKFILHFRGLRNLSTWKIGWPFRGKLVMWNLESMTKKRSSEILADEKTFLGKCPTEKCNLRNFLWEPNKCSEIGEVMGNASLSQGEWTPLPWVSNLLSRPTG